MIKLVPVRVGSHSGYKADEYPEYFVLEERRIEILEISDRWYQGESSPGDPVSDYFKVRTPEGIYLIRHDLASDEWYLCIRVAG